MDSDISKNIGLLANKIVNLLIEKTNGDLSNQIPFLYTCEKTHSINTSFSNIKFDKSNLQVRQHLIDHLLKNELIFISSENVKGVYLTQKALDQKSPYYSLTQRIKNYFESMVNNPESSPPEAVAKVILEAINSGYTHLRFTVGNDASAIIQAKRKMSDSDFTNLIKQQLTSKS